MAKTKKDAKTVAQMKKELEEQFKNDIINRLIQNKIKLGRISEEQEASERERLLRFDQETLLDVLTLTTETLAEKKFLALTERERCR